MVAWRTIAGRIRNSLRHIVARTAAFLCVLLTRITAYEHVADFISLFPFRTGGFVRYYFYKWTLAACGTNVDIGFGSVILNPKSSLGNNIAIGRYNVFGWVDIKDYVMTAQGSRVVSGEHGRSMNQTEFAMSTQSCRQQKVSVGPDVWIGTAAIVMADVATGCVIGAGSVVCASAPAWSVFLGNPARVVYYRKRGSL
jgi:acetyltransferase-like isoleucine patch superfamily enzyme